MIDANMLEAKTRLSQLVEAAERGEQVFLKRNSTLIAQIVPVSKSKLSQAVLRPVYLATLDQNIIKTFELERSFAIFTNHARKSGKD